jgi:hypothetical protein
VIVALVPERLCAPNRAPWPPSTLKSQMRVALNWQTVGADAQWQGTAGHAAAAPDPMERMYELAGLQGGVGEQLAISCTICHELDCWKLSESQDLRLGVEQEMAIRGLLDLLAFYVISVGHCLAAIVVRVLALHPDLRSRLEKRLDSNFPPFDEARKSWPSLGQRLLKDLAQISAEFPQAEQMLSPLLDLVLRSEWREVVSWRAEAFHRWRPQSVGVAGTPKQRWGVKEGGTVTYSVSGVRTPLTSEITIDSQSRAVTLRGVMGDLVATAELLDKAMAQALTDFTGQTFRANG